MHAEKAAWAAAKQHNLDLVVICPSLILGPVVAKRGGLSVDAGKVGSHEQTIVCAASSHTWVSHQAPRPHQWLTVMQHSFGSSINASCGDHALPRRSGKSVRSAAQCQSLYPATCGFPSQVVCTCNKANYGSSLTLQGMTCACTAMHEIWAEHGMHLEHRSTQNKHPEHSTFLRASETTMRLDACRRCWRVAAGRSSSQPGMSMSETLHWPTFAPARSPLLRCVSCLKCTVKLPSRHCDL